MKQVFILLVLLLPISLLAQKQKKVVTEEITIIGAIQNAEIPQEMKQITAKAFTAAICEVYDPWTGECSIWMDPDDPLPSTQGLKYVKERQQATDAFESALKSHKGPLVIQLGSNKIDLKDAYPRFNQAETLASSLLRVQSFIANGTDWASGMK